MLKSGVYSVDRLEGEIAVLTDADGTAYHVLLRDLPDGIGERTMVRFADGVFHRDPSAQKNQEDRIRELQNRLRKRK